MADVGQKWEMERVTQVGDAADCVFSQRAHGEWLACLKGHLLVVWDVADYEALVAAD